ncbi:hypothetical protein, partial [Actinomadura roseirufa]|uniref:hypothetical protein n=1 Tax=Actinomadura roseirufa TaxID=2094049 RepID=UPI001A954EB5
MFAEVGAVRPGKTVRRRPRAAPARGGEGGEMTHAGRRDPGTEHASATARAAGRSCTRPPGARARGALALLLPLVTPAALGAVPAAP